MTFLSIPEMITKILLSLVLVLGLSACTTMAPIPPEHPESKLVSLYKDIPSKIQYTLKGVKSVKSCPCEESKGVHLSFADYEYLYKDREKLRDSLYKENEAYIQEIKRGNALVDSLILYEDSMWLYKDALYITEKTLDRERTWFFWKDLLKTVSFGAVGLGVLLLN